MLQVEKEVKVAIADYNNGSHSGMTDEMETISNLHRQEGWSDNVLRKCVKGGHQWCLPNVRIEEAVVALRQFDFNRTYANFEEVYDAVKMLIGGIPRVSGWLTLYDTTRRLSHILPTPVVPSDYVYIARGARDGAKYVLDIKRMKGNVFRLPTSDFRHLFPNSTSMQIEDMLCIYFHEGKLRDDIAKGCGKKRRKGGDC